MSTRLGTFSPNKLDIIITQSSTGISHRISGVSEDSIVTIDRATDTFSMYIGADDTGSRVANINTSATVTISLQQTAASNDILTQLYENDRQTLDSSGLFNIMIRDSAGRSYYFAEEAYVASPPSSPFANSMQTREWVIQCYKMQTYIGGNSLLSSEDVATLEALGAVIDPKWRE